MPRRSTTARPLAGCLTPAQVSARREARTCAHWPPEWHHLLGVDAVHLSDVHALVIYDTAKAFRAAGAAYLAALKEEEVARLGAIEPWPELDARRTISQALDLVAVSQEFAELEARGRRTGGKGRTVDPRRGRIVSRLLTPFRPDWPTPTARDLALFSVAAGVVPNGKHKDFPALLAAEVRAMRAAAKDAGHKLARG